MSLDPIRASQHIQDAYFRYLRTAFPLQDASLAEQFRQALEDAGKFVKGPYLEATPPFEKGASLEDMVVEHLLVESFRRLESEALPLRRSLYRHQDLAIRKAVGLRRNLIIATGTGSGKTESFLVPIFDHLLREEKQGALGPGVRALLLYPMNALANDQLKRLRRLLAAYPTITFGRYTGETKETTRVAETHFRQNYPDEPRITNELLSREEMREAPPHILLTNYAMLEYLLLRPQDCEFFDGDLARHWRFFVLDEVHTYNGAVGIEMAMLLRRLKDRVVQSRRARIQCLATSATLGRGQEDFPAIVRFAQQLFDETFEWDDHDLNRQDVVAATRVPLEFSGTSWGEPDPACYYQLRENLRRMHTSGNLLVQVARNHGVPEDVAKSAGEAFADGAGTERVRVFLHRLLQGDGRLQRLRVQLQNGPAVLNDLAAKVFGSEEAEDLVALVDLAVMARDGENSLPLLPARYHLFVRALEGAYLCLTPTPHLLLDRAQTLERDGDTFRVFELASCKRCGELYLVGKVRENKLRPPPSLSEDNRDDPEFYRLLRPEGRDELPDDEDEEVAAGDAGTAEATAEIHFLCGRCGAIDLDNNNLCDCPQRDGYRWRVQRVPTHKRQVNRCPACGTRSPGIVIRFLTGQDAPASVLTTALYQDIPPGESADTLPPSNESPEEDWGAATPAAPTDNGGDGRKLLAFSDSRQDAAFFACYLDRTYQQVLRRRLIVLALERHPNAVAERWRLQDLVPPVLRIAQEHRLFTEKLSPREQENEVWKWLLLELLAYDRRNSLEGLGILSFVPFRPANWVPPPPLTTASWGLAQEEVWSLYQVLLNSFRHQGAITYPDGVSPTAETFAPRNREYYFRNADAVPKQRIFSWSSPTKGKRNRRLDFLRKLYRRINGIESDQQELNRILDNIWQKTLLTKPLAQLLQQATVPNEGVVHRYRCEFFELAGFGQGGWYRCNQCGNVSQVNLRGVCTTYGCEGEMRKCDPSREFADNHYAQLYRGLQPIRMEVAEHTAQLTSEAAAELQDKFIRNEVNVLSCSTTFELGVDVGELEAVLLRNVPPETANYVQRAGRAGRRSASTAFALTFCQRRSHDLTYFQHPERMIAGQVRPPYFELLNPKIIQRHGHAVALAWFFRQQPALFGNVNRFFFTDNAPTGPVELRRILAGRPPDLQGALERIIPSAMREELGVTNWSWVDGLLRENEGVLDRADHLVRNDVQQLEAVRQQLMQAGRPSDYLLRAINTIKQKDLIGFLANHNVLPKYGFPVDVVELDLLHHGAEARRLELERDLRIAISEYAPGSEVVAGGRLWTSRGLKRLPNLEWPKFYYAVCDQCGRYHRSRFETGQRPTTCSCGASLEGVRKRFQFLTPIFGFQTDTTAPKKPTESRPERTYSTRVFFAGEGHAADEPHTFQARGIRLQGQFSRSSQLAVLNWSRFKVCERCGRAAPVWEQIPRPHRPPWSEERTCNGTLHHWDLGHEFNTDIFGLRVTGFNADESVWRSLLYALLEGASEVLNIRRDDLDGCLYPYAGTGVAPALVLFDNVPGGAGHVRRVGQDLEAVLRAARDRVDGRCGCGGGPDGSGDTSCYGCLRNYRNQWAHDQLVRGPVYRFLQRLIGKEPLTP